MPKKPTPSRKLFAALVDDDFGMSRLERCRDEVRQALDSTRPIHDHLPPLGRAIVDTREELT